MGRFWRLSVTSITIILIDQLTKASIQSSFYTGESHSVLDGFFSIVYMRNSGGLFGTFENSSLNSIAYTFLPIFICIALFTMVIKTIKLNFYLPLGYSLILTGAFSNLLDRLSSSEVLDYFQVMDFPSFNLADFCIFVGLSLISYDLVISLKKKKDGSDVASTL